jgi:hypothetical protein
LLACLAIRLGKTELLPLRAGEVAPNTLTGFFNPFSFTALDWALGLSLAQSANWDKPPDMAERRQYIASIQRG